MENLTFSKYSWLDFVLTVIGVGTFLFDVISDLWVAKEFYVHGEFFWFGAVIGVMFMSSVIVQMFSWFWLTYDRELENFESPSSSERVIFFGYPKRVALVCFLHVFQLGFFLRHLSAIWQGFRVWWRGDPGSEFAVYLIHDLSMLRLIETFCESAPQLTLMAYIMLRTHRARPVQYVSAAASTTAIAWMVVDYHRSLRSFLPDKAKQGWGSSVLYFLWNLLLIGPRLATLAMFASVLPCCVAAHFLALWPVLVLWVWKQETQFMDSPSGEWLYRATVGLIWYFSWFNVSEGQTKGRSIIYHSFLATDCGILLTTWWWYRDAELTQSYALIFLVLLPLSYSLGLVVKTIYYCFFHPKLRQPSGAKKGKEDSLDGQVPFKTAALQTDGPPQLLNKRMARLASSFY